MPTITVMNKHKDQPGTTRQELLVRFAERIWDVEVLSGDGALHELGANTALSVGLNAWATDTGAAYAVLILGAPPLTQAQAQKEALLALQGAGFLPEELTVQGGQWADFAAHPEGQIILDLQQMVLDLAALPPEARGERVTSEDEFWASLGLDAPSPESAAATQERQDTRYRENVSRGYERLKAAQPGPTLN